MTNTDAEYKIFNTEYRSMVLCVCGEGGRHVYELVRYIFTLKLQTLFYIQYY